MFNEDNDNLGLELIKFIIVKFSIYLRMWLKLLSSYAHFVVVIFLFIDIPNENMEYETLINILQQVRADYFILGVYLELPSHMIKEFEKVLGDCDRCLSDTISLWFDKGPTKAKLKEALIGIDRRNKAMELMVKYEGNMSICCVYMETPIL